MNSAKHDIQLVKGDTFSLDVIFDESQAGSTFAASLNGTAMTCSLGADDVTVTVSMAATDTANLIADGTTLYKWRLVRTTADVVTTILYGKASVIDV